MALRGHRAHIRRLQALAGPEMTREVEGALFAGGQLIESHAKRSITAGSVSGKGHVPSSPGEPPNNDTGVLKNNIETTKVGVLRVRVSSNAPYSAPLEFGTSKMAARPYMRPARDAKKKEVQKLVQKAVNRAVKKSKRTD